MKRRNLKMGWIKGMWKGLIWLLVFSLLLGFSQVGGSFGGPEESKKVPHFLELMRQHKEIEALRDFLFKTLSSSPKRLTTHQFNYIPWGNVWSRNNEILFVSDRGGHLDLWKMDQNGGNLAQLTDDSNFEWCGSWSPDGEKIAYFRWFGVG